MWRRAFASLLGLSLAACATSAENVPGPRYAVSSRDVLTAAEIVASRVTNVYQAVSQLRPQFLRHRNTRPTALAPNEAVVVYLDDLPYGGVESLHQIPLERVRLIRFVSAMNATTRFGGLHPSGAILVTTVAGRPR